MPADLTDLTHLTPEAGSMAEVKTVKTVKSGEEEPPQGPEPPGASDPETLLAFLHREGPSTYGAAASSLGWGATRAWQAEARPRAAGTVRYDGLGKAHPVAKGGPA